MIELTPKNIQLHARAGNKEEAIREAGRLLVELGCIDPGYIESMLAASSRRIPSSATASPFPTVCKRIAS